MKILLITSHLKIGGIPVYVVTLANYLRKRGHTVFVASSGGQLKSGLSPEIAHIDIPLDTHSVLSPKVWAAVLMLLRLIKKEKIDIMHTHTRVAHCTAHILSKIAGVPYVVTWHGFYRPHFFRKFMPFWGARTIAISRTVYANLKDVFKRDESKIRLVFNGVDTPRFINDYSEDEKRAIRRKYNLTDGPIIGIVSRLSPEKGHAYLIEAFKGVLAVVPRAQLVIVGEGRSEPVLKDRVRELGISHAVHFFRETLNIKELLAIMEVFTRPSVKEGFGLAVVEAMLMGLPVVSTDVGGFRSILDHGKVGILVAPENSTELKKALIRVLSDPPFAKEMGEEARRYAASNFSAERMAAQIEDVYKEVINEVGRP